jgi:hypothetical protein
MGSKQQLGFGWGKGPHVTPTALEQQLWDRHLAHVVDVGAPTAPESPRPREKRRMAKARLRPRLR